MNVEQIRAHIEEMKQKSPEKLDRAITLTALQQAIYSSFVDLELCDQDILALLVQCLLEMADAKGMTDDDLHKSIERAREIRALVIVPAKGGVQ